MKVSELTLGHLGTEVSYTDANNFFYINGTLRGFNPEYDEVAVLSSKEPDVYLTSVELRIGPARLTLSPYDEITLHTDSGVE